MTRPCQSPLGRTFTTEDVEAIRQTHEIAIANWDPFDEATVPAAVTRKWHDLNSAQLFAVCHSSVRGRVTDEQIAAKMHRLQADQTTHDIWTIYGLAFEDAG